MPEQLKEFQTEAELIDCVQLIRAAYGTVANEFNLTEANAPTNPAFITIDRLKEYLKKKVKLFGLFANNVLVGCVAVESSNDKNIYYIERLAVNPNHRHHKYGDRLLNHAFDYIKENTGTIASIGLMDNNTKLKEWYKSKGFIETGKKDFPHLPFSVCFMSKTLNS